MAGKGPAQPKTSLIAHIGATKKDANEFVTTIVFKATENSQALQYAEIRLFKDNVVPIPGAYATNQHGECVYIHKEDEKMAGKVINIRASLSEQRGAIETSFSLTMIVEGAPAAPGKPSAKYAEIKEHGQEGDYYLTVQVLNDKGKGEKFKLVISEGLKKDQKTILPDDENPHFCNTNENGMVVVDLKAFQDKKRIVHVLVEGTDIDREIKLEGPKQSKFVGEIKKGKGFWGNLFQLD